MAVYNYNRRRAYEYALVWAYRRNPLFIDFTGIGGNCTNFVSQCILAGSCIMNFTPTFGWYYISSEDRAPAWSGVEFLYNFLTTNDGEGPFGTERDVTMLSVGDVVQLSDETGDYYHTLLVVGRNSGDILLAAQSNDAFARPLSTYSYSVARGIHIEGYRTEFGECDCFDGLISGRELNFCGGDRR